MARTTCEIDIQRLRDELRDLKLTVENHQSLLGDILRELRGDEQADMGPLIDRIRQTARDVAAVTDTPRTLTRMVQIDERNLERLRQAFGVAGGAFHLSTYDQIINAVRVVLDDAGML